MQNAILHLLQMTDGEKKERGLVWTPSEIYRQPETWKSTFQIFSGNKDRLAHFLEECGFSSEGGGQPDVLLVGAGTSDYVGRAVAPLLRRCFRCGVTAVPSTDLLTNIPDYILPGKKYLMVSFSRSANSSEGVAVLEQLRRDYERQVRHLVVTCNAQGKMAQLSGVFKLVLDELVDDKGLAMTSSFTNMVVAGECLANINSLPAYGSSLETAMDRGAKLMPVASDLASELAKKHFRRICFLGSGILHAVAEESALKVLELNAGKIPTLAQSHLGLRHGPLSFINQETLVVSYLSAEEPRRSYDLDLLAEIRHKNLGAEIAIIAPRSEKRVTEVGHHVLSAEVPDGFRDDYLPIVDVIFGQLLGLFTSIENKITPDTPSTSGAISRVVTQVKIHSYSPKRVLAGTSAS